MIKIVFCGTYNNFQGSGNFKERILKIDKRGARKFFYDLTR
jgi:hypothetical protein